MVAQRELQRTEEMKEGDGGLKRRCSLRGGGHLRERKGFQKVERGFREGWWVSGGIKEAQGLVRGWGLVEEQRAPCQCTEQSCSC